MRKFIIIKLEHDGAGSFAETTHQIYDTYAEAECIVRELLKSYNDKEWLLDNTTDTVLNRENDQKFIEYILDEVDV